MSCTLQLLLAAFVIIANDFDRKSNAHKLLRKETRTEKRQENVKGQQLAVRLHDESGQASALALS